MVFHPKLPKLLNDANLMLDQIRVLKLRSAHGVSDFTR
jgi:alpha-N-acetylglucosamine transferase